MFNRKKNKETEENYLSFEEIKKENEQLYSQLTKKNRDYMFQLNSRLEEMAYDSKKKEYAFNKMLHETIAGQSQSIPARRIYGTVTEQADNIVGTDLGIPAGEQDKSPGWMLYMDGALLMGGLFGVVNGIASWQSTGESVGLLQVLMNFLIGGLAILVLTKYAPQQGQTKGLLKYIVATIGVMFFWVTILTFVLAAVPDALNPTLPGPLVIGIAVVALLARWYLKKKLDIKGTIF